MMRSAALPVDEMSRLETLHQIALLDTAPEERFDRLTRMAKRMFGVPIALVGLVDSERVWFKARIGLAAREFPRDLSLCGHAILGDGLLLVPDTLQDARFFDNPAVLGPPHIRFYAGHPLCVGAGKMGTLCLIDHVPRLFGTDDQALLRDLAVMAERELVAVQLAVTDELTGLANKRGFQSSGEQSLRGCKRLRLAATLLFFDLNHFKAINDTFGHAEGDRALVRFAAALREVFRESDVIARLGGDEFLVLLSGADGAATNAILSRLRAWVERCNLASGAGYALRYSVGQCEFVAARHAAIDDLIRDADAAMYQAKQRGRGAPGAS
jgi:diguanylate cyclase (GGDEF)-like protein